MQSSTLATKRNNDGDMTKPEEKWTEFLKRYLEILSSKTRSTNKGVTAKQAKNMSMADLEISVLCFVCTQQVVFVRSRASLDNSLD